MKSRRGLVILAGVMLSLAVAGCGTSNKTSSQRWSSPPKMQINKSKQYDAVVKTNYGSFTIQLFAKQSPITVNNFVFLSQHHFYKNDKFFRVIQPFMIQTGDPNNNGTGGPGYQFKDELPPKQPYQPGIVAMANSGPNTNGSQFFICTGIQSETLNSDPKYTQFGKVTQGMSVVQKIAAVPVKMNPQTHEQSMPTKDVYIESVKIQVH
ncbi:peptidylprolyl isomerase [Alicyclobacillus sp. SO9]|uniref:peptidylprolyl isomerase n=1 Tax=Alicyclobacillus sp. SO9 TaxID=2665646 RepID=UPI001E571D2A|nr:peptidylprolyl isomerase [Alicyclobacillus sp. SO9]